MTAFQPVKVATGKMLIGSEWVPARSGKTFAAINPATEKELAQVAYADAEDVNQAVAAARAAAGLVDAGRGRHDGVDLAVRPPPWRHQLPPGHDPGRRDEPLRLALNAADVLHRRLHHRHLDERAVCGILGLRRPHAGL